MSSAQSDGRWLEGGGLVRSRPWAIVVSSVSGALMIQSLFDALRQSHAWSSSGYAVLSAAVMAMFLPSAVLGTHRSPGVRLSSVCTLSVGAAFTLFAIAAQVEPDWLDPDRTRDQILRVALPGLAVLTFGFGLYLMRISFRKVEPTTYDARHAERD